MKFILLLTLLSPFSYAAMDFSIEKSDADGLFKLGINDSGKTVDVVKTSNWFDRQKDLRLGHFAGDEKKLKVIVQKLSAIETEVKKADDVLKQHGSSMNDLGKVTVHNTYFVINGIRILPSSPFYKPLMDISANIDTSKMKLIEGVELAEKKKEYLFFENAKVVNKEKFRADFFCDTPDRPVKCQARKWGVLFL